MSIKYHNEIKKTYKKLVASKSKEEKQFYNLYGYWPKCESLAKRASKEIKSHKLGEKNNWPRKTNEELGLQKNQW